MSSVGLGCHRGLVPHSFDQPEHRRAIQGIVRVADRPEDELFFVRVRILSAIDGARAVDRATIVFAKERARLLSECAITIFVRGQIGYDKLIGRFFARPRWLLTLPQT